MNAPDTHSGATVCPQNTDVPASPLLSAIADVVWSMDLSLRFSYLSPAVEPFLGYPAEALIGCCLTTYLAPTSRAAAESFLEDSLASFTYPPAPHILALEFIHQNGSRVWGEISFAFLCSPEQRPVGLTGVTRDITRRMAASAGFPETPDQLQRLLTEKNSELKTISEKLQNEKSLHQLTAGRLNKSRSKYRLLVEKATQGILVTQDGDLKFWNPKVSEVSGYSDQELERIAFLDLIHPEDRPMLIEHHRRRLAGEPVEENYTLRILDKNGKTRWIEIYSVVVGWEERPATLSFVTDVTFRKMAEVALQERERLYRSLYNNSVVGLIRSRISDGRVLHGNRRAAQILGYGSVSEMTSRCRLSDFHSPRRRAELIDQLKRLGEVSGFESMVTLENGEEKWISISARLDDPQDYIEGVVLDVTQQKQTEAALKLSMQAAEAANIAKSEFLANMSHEIRTPLNGIIGMCDIMLGTDLSAKHREHLGIIRTSGIALLELINDILDLSKIESGKLELEQIPFSLHRLIEEVVDLFFDKISAKTIELIVDIAPDVPDHINADPLRFRQVLINLLSNAVKFTETGEICIQVRQTSLAETQTTLLFCVKDTGIGIPEEAQQHLFDAFTQADGSITRKYGGTGLGLAICKRIVDMMAGRLWVESTIGRGSRFYFTADFQVAHAPNTAQPDIAGLLGTRHVLLIDDHPVALTVMSNIMDGLGFRVTAATALEEIPALIDPAIDPVDVIFLDSSLPGTGGLMAMRQLQSYFQGALPPVVLLVVSEQSTPAKRAKEAGYSHVLTKPVKQSSLFDTLMSVFGFQLPKLPVHEHGILGFTAESGALRILLVEDNAINQRVAREMLACAGLSVDIAQNGREAVEAVKQGEYALVLMDIQMPEMDGLEASRIIRWNLGMTELPIIALTAHTMPGDREKCMDAGMSDYVAKPIDRDELFAAMRRHLPEHCASAAPAPSKPQGAYPLTPETALKGLNMTEGIARVGGDTSLYMDILKDYCEHYRGFPDMMMSLLTAGDLDAAKRCAHSLKGAAGNIAAKDLHRLAADLEIACREKDPNQAEGLLKDVDAALIVLHESVAQLVTTLPGAGDAISPKKTTSKS
ncbi:MAG: response regulator [Pseudomonadota bacterium]